jgi:hypothetical protein
MNAEEFAMRVAAVTTNLPLEDIETAYAKASNPTDNLEPVVGIDPMTILAIITAIVQVMEFLNKNCNKPKLLSQNSRIRNPLLTAIFRARVHFAAKKANYEGDTQKLADAMLDVAHNSGEKAVEAVLADLNSY